MKIYDAMMRVVEQHIAPLAAKVGAQRHVRAMRDGFIVAMPFIIVGSFVLIFAFPPFDQDTTNAFGRAWIDFATTHFDTIMMPHFMSMALMGLFVSMGVAYSLAKSYGMDGITSAALALMSFLLVASPASEGALSMQFLGGTGVFTAVLSGFFAVELYRVMKKYNITIRMPEQVPPAIQRSFEVLLPVVAVFITLYPLSIWLQTQHDMLIPQAIMEAFKPLVSASNTLPAIIGALLLCQLLWFAGIHGAAIVVGLLGPIFLTNLTVNIEAFVAGEEVPNIFTQPFWDFYIFIGGSGATLALVALMSFSRSAHLKSLGRMSAVPGFFQINEPVIFGSPIVMNPTLFLPFVFVPIINATVAYFAVHTGFVGMGIATMPWTTPAIIGASWGAGWTLSPVLLVVLLFVMDLFLYYPFFKIFERELLAEEKQSEESEQQTSPATGEGVTA
ncbi:putative PTS system, cellobiose-specific IIC component [Vibrio nigripulchritudo SFn27]|uniref:Permease IIC component n=1 Tax=Vibrio nigripulchritudo TaxID=28173 RepID=U4KGX6_9VIBR|nr:MULTISPECIES: PTS sugar transporter subunit IIC [Vibrio]KJY66924.1 PTS sugar transporter [Vibrio nigripulchritudo]UAB69933.1 PTS sugar transporter subunit IIC [Vibrio sp. SCSIO 43132]CCN80521.1 putative PTS system, cellobiose-specific IIC component [Vibrio nigripulchritudo BLFn1]CCN89986.1 putative PTS system, cellobiose-specific IIC component [Vibrio nigripulchritudo SFn27]CCN93661.1 putative PTS system, cellobiose-specific IIC component [Vibrio nigripulchritudo ENn2]